MEHLTPCLYPTAHLAVTISRLFEVLFATKFLFFKVLFATNFCLSHLCIDLLHTYPDISLIVIDTLQKVRKTERNGSMYANDYRDIGALKELADKYGICILLVHHLRKQSSSDPYD